MSKSISLDLLTVIEHESRNFIWNNKLFVSLRRRFKILNAWIND